MPRDLATSCLRRHYVNETGAEEDKRHGEHGPSKVLHGDVTAEHVAEVVEEPHSRGVAHGDAEVHGEGHDGHEDAEDGQEDPVLAKLGERPVPDVGDDVAGSSVARPVAQHL